MKIFLAFIALFVVVSAQNNPCEDEFLAFLPHPERCESFIMCQLGRPITLHCDPNFIWFQDGRRCRLGNQVTCEFRFGPEPSCEDEFFSIHYFYDDCTRFFMCMMGERINFECPPGQIYDSSQRACVPGDDFLCIAHDPSPYNKV